MKYDIWWVIKSGNIYLPFTGRVTRSQCIQDYETLESTSWNRLSKRGISAVKVKVIETLEVQNKKSIQANKAEAPEPTEAAENEGLRIPGGGSSEIQ
jgi:hypothetical protein